MSSSALYYCYFGDKNYVLLESVLVLVVHRRRLSPEDLFYSAPFDTALSGKINALVERVQGSCLFHILHGEADLSP
jgi:hypothetical protein